MAFGSVSSLQSGAIAPAVYSSSRFMSVSAILHAAAARDAARDAAACCRVWDRAPRGGRTRDKRVLSREGRGLEGEGGGVRALRELPGLERLYKRGKLEDDRNRLLGALRPALAERDG